ncbi:MAG: type IV secretory system conjugative DNA transfer family protein [Acidimicrobiales bacterium]
MTVAVAGEAAAAAVLVVAAALTGALGGAPGGWRRGSQRGGEGPDRWPGQRAVGPPGLGTRPTGGPWPRGPSASARWAGPSAIRRLAVSGTPPGRLCLGAALGPRRLGGRTPLAAEAAQSVAVVGPTQSGKTTGLAVPAILTWQGPVLAASVKTDLVRDTLAWRRRCGRVWCFDPGRTTGLPPSEWSPLGTARTWTGARRVAADLTEVTRGEGTTPDGEFWYATAAKLLAPLLFAAATAGATMADVVRWVDTQEVEEVLDILAAAGVPEALQAARASWQRDERQRSAVYTTAETILEPYAGDSHLTTGRSGSRADDTPPLGVRLDSPSLPSTSAPDVGEVDPEQLLGGDHTLYVCAPAHDQRRLRGLFVAVVKQVLEAGFARATRAGAPLDPPLLVVLDEAANIAPLADLDGLAATCAGHGIQLVTVWQDLAQVRARYGERASTVVNNHRAKLFLSGTSDPVTLDHASHLVGEEELLVSSVTTSAAGERTVTASPLHRPLLPPDALRRMPPGTGVLLYGTLPPIRVALQPWHQDVTLAARAGGGSTGTGRGRGRWGRRWRSRRARGGGRVTGG